MFKFGKIRESEFGYTEINVNDVWCPLYDGNEIDDLEYDIKFPEYANMEYEKFKVFINTAYLNYRTSLATKKLAKRTIDNTNHWYKYLSEEKRTELCLRMKPKFSAMIEEYIAQHPSNKLNNYYLDLCTRVQASNYPAFPMLSDKDIAKLPHYSSQDDGLFGTVPMFVKLASVVYPSIKRPRNKHVIM